LEICKRLSEEKGDPSIEKDAQEIFDNIHSTSLSDPEKIKKTSEFYDKH
jgi:hypothetical protein